MQIFVSSLRQNQLFDWLVSSPESSAQASFSDQNLSAVHSCRHKLFTLFFLLQDHWAIFFNQTWHEAFLGELEMKAHTLFPGEIRTK